MARRYTRDNRGRFASVGATARGGRLLTAAGNKRATQTAKLSGGGRKGTVAKPKGLKPGAITGKIKPRDAAKRANQLNDRANRLEKAGNGLMTGGRNDRAAANIGLNSRTRRNETSAGFRGLEMTQTASKMRSRAGNSEARAAQSSAKALRDAAKPKRTRSQESLRMSRAKQIEKRRHDNIKNPAAWRQDSAGRMAANAKRTQERALALYKTGGKGVKPVASKVAGNNAARSSVGKAFKRSGKAQKVIGRAPKSTVSQSLDTRNKQRREAAFKRRVNRAADNMRGAGSVYQTYAQAHKFGNAPGQGVKIERSYKQALQREATAKKALAVYQGTARPTVNDSRVYGRPYGMNRPAVSRTSKGYRAMAEPLRTPSKAAQRQGRAAARHASASADRRHYRGVNRAATLGTTARASKFYKNPVGYLARAKDKKGRPLVSGAGFRMPKNTRS